MKCLLSDWAGQREYGKNKKLANGLNDCDVTRRHEIFYYCSCNALFSRSFGTIYWTTFLDYYLCVVSSASSFNFCFLIFFQTLVIYFWFCCVRLHSTNNSSYFAYSACMYRHVPSLPVDNCACNRLLFHGVL